MKEVDLNIFVVRNGEGMEAEVPLAVPQKTNPKRRAGLAIMKASRVLPNVKPWKCVDIIKERKD